VVEDHHRLLGRLAIDQDLPGSRLGRMIAIPFVRARRQAKTKTKTPEIPHSSLRAKRNTKTRNWKTRKKDFRALLFRVFVFLFFLGPLIKARE
jgi:hypothetical protein